MPSPLWSQGSCRVVAPVGLLKASLSGPAALMNTAAPAAFPPVTGVWLSKAEAAVVYLLPVGCVHTHPSPLCSDVNMQQWRKTPILLMMWDYLLVVCFFSCPCSSSRIKLDNSNSLQSALSRILSFSLKALLFWGGIRLCLNSWTLWEAHPLGL